MTFVEKFNKLGEVASSWGITRGMALILLVVYTSDRNPVTQVDIVEVSGLGSGGVSKSLRRLEELCFVTQTAAVGMGRGNPKCVKLTTVGYEVASEVYEAVELEVEK